MVRPRYIVVTPARNEAENITYTIQSMAAQTWRPFLWIIVDDGSTDATATIIDAAAKEHPWVIALHRPDRGYRRQGGGVVETFYAGYERIQSEPWDFLVKFDADLSFSADFFERCIGEFAKNPKLGIGGGLICQEHNGRLECESPGDPTFHVRGATKIYRRACWEAIGGLLHAPGWDTVDELKANMLGWETCSFRDIPLRHHRFTGSADGTWKTYVKFGLANYITGYHPLFMALKCLKRMLEPPYLLGGLGLSWGFINGCFGGAPRVSDREFIRYVRQQQMNRLFGRPSLWDTTMGRLSEP
jgi:glycosyltransferase involved in cell wall biosynthesis